MSTKAKPSGEANHLQVIGITCLAISATCVVIIRLLGKPMTSASTIPNPIFWCLIAWLCFSEITTIVMILKPRFLTLLSLISIVLLILLILLIKEDTLSSLVVNSTQDLWPVSLLLFSIFTPTFVGFSRFLYSLAWITFSVRPTGHQLPLRRTPFYSLSIFNIWYNLGTSDFYCGVV